MGGEICGEAVNVSGKTTEDHGALGLLVRFRLCNIGCDLVGFEDFGALGIVGSHVVEHFPKKQGVAGDSLDRLHKQLAQTDAILWISSLVLDALLMGEHGSEENKGRRTSTYE